MYMYIYIQILKLIIKQIPKQIMNLNSRNVDKIQKALQDLQQLSSQQIASLSSQQSLSELRIKRIENLKANIATKSQSSEHELSADHDYSSQQHNQSQGKKSISSHGVNWGLFKQMPIVSSREAKNNFEAEFTKKLQMYRQHIREEQEKNIQEEPKVQSSVEQLSKQKKQNRKQGGIFLPVLNNQTGPFSFPAQKHTNTFINPHSIPVNNSLIFSSSFPNQSKPFESTPPWGEMKIKESTPPASIGFGNGIFSNKGNTINPVSQKKLIQNKDEQKKDLIQQPTQIQQNKGFVPGNNVGSNNSLFSKKLADVPQVAPPEPIKPASSLFSDNNPLSHIKIDKAPIFNQNIQPSPEPAKKQVPNIFGNLNPPAPKVNIFAKSLTVQQPEAPKQIEIDKKGGLFSNSNPWTENQKSNQQFKSNTNIFMSNVADKKKNEQGLFAANKNLPFGEKLVQNIHKAPLFSGETKTVSGGGLNNIFSKTTPQSTNMFGSSTTPPPTDNLFQNIKINTPNPLPFSTLTTNKTPLFSSLQPQAQSQSQNQKQDQDKTIFTKLQSQTPPSIFGQSAKSIFGGNESKKQQKYQSGSLFTNSIPSQPQKIDNKQPLPTKEPSINIFANPPKATNQQQSKQETKMQFKLPSKEEQQLKAFPNSGGSLFGQKQQNLGIFGNAKMPFASLQPQKSQQAQKASIFNLKAVPVQNQKQKIVQISSNTPVQKQNQQQGPADDSSKKSAPKKANELFKDFANSNPENMFNKQGRTLGSINIFKSNVPQSQSIFNKPMKPALGLFANPTKPNIFGNPSTNSIFEKVQKVQKDEQQEQDEEGEEQAGIEDKQQIDPTKSTGNYKYEESEIKFKQQVLKLKRGDQNIVENVILSIQKFVGSKNHIVGVRFANKCPYFMGSIIYGVSEVSKIKENQYKNLAVKKLLFTKEDGKPALENLKIQFKDQKHGTAFFAAFQKVQKKQTD